MDEEPIPIAIVYALPTEEGGLNVAAQLTKFAYDKKYNTYSALFVSCACVSLYECFLAHVKESGQNEFEELFKMTFEKVFDVKENYTDTIKLDDDEY